MGILSDLKNFTGKKKITYEDYRILCPFFKLYDREYYQETLFKTENNKYYQSIYYPKDFNFIPEDLKLIVFFNNKNFVSAYIEKE